MGFQEDRTHGFIKDIMTLDNDGKLKNHETSFPYMFTEPKTMKLEREIFVETDSVCRDSALESFKVMYR